MTKYIILAIVVVLVNFAQSFFLATGGVYADSISYFEIASDLPKPVTDLFPLGYPALLRGFYALVGDYFWAYKFLNLSMLIVVFLFSYFKKFFFRETVLLFVGKTLLFAFSIAISEGTFLFLMYFLFYLFYRILETDSYNYKDVIAASIIMLLMFLVRYSGIYIYFAIGLFSLFLFFKTDDRKRFWACFSFLIIAGLGISGYLAFNYINFGSFTGEDLRGIPSEITALSILRNVLGTINTINPYIGLKPSSNSIASFAFQFLVMIVDIMVLVYFLRFFKKVKATSGFYFHIFLWLLTVVYVAALFVSGWTQQIEEMNTRMMAAANVCLFFSFLILYFKFETSDKIIWRISCFFFVFITLYALKSPVSYFENRKHIEPQMTQFKDKKYLYNDEIDQVVVTTYHIPVLNKSFQYTHSNTQSGYIKRSIAGTINPKSKYLSRDTVTDKSQVLYTSEIVLHKIKK